MPGTAESADKDSTNRPVCPPIQRQVVTVHYPYCARHVGMQGFIQALAASKAMDEVGVQRLARVARVRGIAGLIRRKIAVCGRTTALRPAVNSLELL